MNVRRYEDADRSAVLALAPRLAEGVAAWRPADGVLAAATAWVVEALARSAEADRFVFVAEHPDEGIAGFVSGEHRSHWSGQRELYVGELVVALRSERCGVGRALMDAVAGYAKAHGVATITLDTGAANVNARAFYNRLGFAEEDVKLTKVLS